MSFAINILETHSNRELEWQVFSESVREHIVNYTIPQYGDLPNDMASTFDKSQFDLQLRKYITRQCRGNTSRGRAEDMRDYLKIAHYACMAYMQMKREEQSGTGQS